MTVPTLTRWEDDAACRTGTGVDPEWFWPDDRANRAAGDTSTGLALHICLAHCPVRERCAQAAEQDPPRYPTVLAGVRYAISKESGRHVVRPARRGPAPHPHGCPYCRRGA